MTELNLAYSNNNYDMNNDDDDEAFTMKEKVQAQIPQQQSQQVHQQQQAQQQVQQHQQQVQQQKQILPPPQLRVKAENFTNHHGNHYNNRYPEYSFWDRMVMSRREVLKLFILSIVIILGISLEKIGCHYIMMYINSNDLTTFQDLMVRLSFPIIVFIILWIIKSL